MPENLRHTKAYWLGRHVQRLDAFGTPRPGQYEVLDFEAIPFGQLTVYSIKLALIQPDGSRKVAGSFSLHRIREA